MYLACYLWILLSVILYKCESSIENWYSFSHSCIEEMNGLLLYVIITVCCQNYMVKISERATAMFASHTDTTLVINTSKNHRFLVCIIFLSRQHRTICVRMPIPIIILLGSVVCFVAICCYFSCYNLFASSGNIYDHFVVSCHISKTSDNKR
jgi:hypothetical protein